MKIIRSDQKPFFCEAVPLEKLAHALCLAVLFLLNSPFHFSGCQGSGPLGFARKNFASVS